MRDGKRRGRAADKRRAGAYLAHLEWLALLDGTWTRFDTGEPFEPDGALVAKTKRAARTVMREHGEVLPKLVGEVARWWAIVDAKLRWCTTRGTFDPLPWLPVRVRRTIVELARTPVGTAATRSAIAHVLDPDLVERLVDWLAEHRTIVLEVADPDRAWVWLSRLAVLGEPGKAQVVRERGVEALLALLAVDAPDPQVALEVTRHLESRLRGNKPKPGPSPVPGRSRSRVEAWLETLVARPRAELQRVLALLAEAELAEALAPWQAWEAEHAALVGRARELAGVTFAAWEKTAHDLKVIAKLETMRSRAPAPVAIRDVFLEVDLLAIERFARFQPALLHMLRALPAALGPAARTRWLLHAARCAATADDDEHVEWAWDALAEALDEAAPLGILGPWRAVLRGEGRVYADNDLVEGAKRRGDVQRAVRVLVELAWRGELVRDDPGRLVAWLRAGVTDEPVVADVVAGLREVDGYFHDATARVAVLLASSLAAGELIALGTAVIQMSETWRSDRVARLGDLAAHARKSDATWIVRAAVLGKHTAVLAELADAIALVPRNRWPAIARPARDLAWIGRYPAALHPALQRLATVTPDARKAAAKRLADDLPDPEDLAREIAALRERLGRPGVAKRLANLEARLAAPELPSPARLGTLSAKLERAAEELGLARFVEAITEIARDRLVRAFGLAELPAWGRPGPSRSGPSARIATLLVALLELEPRDRELAARLVRARCGPPPWDLRDDPVNRAFLDELRAARIDPEPWLDDTPVICRPEHGEPFTLAMTSDPLEVFAMGAHFETCLSPDGGNYFSVVANAADLNKRVIYARREGKVIGRCLIALTDALGILTFQVYAHDRIGLETHVRDFVLDLARRMGTTVVARGSVRLLLARDWYDDGARDLAGRFRGLEATGLDFSTIDPAALVGVLRAAFDRDLDDVTLPMVLGHAQVVKRPELVFPLAPAVMASRASLTRIAGAELALRAGDRELASRLLGDHGQALRLDDHPFHHGQTVAELRPSSTLARLRESRRRDVRSWQDEPGDRMALAGIAFAALHRRKQAAALFHLAMDREPWLAPYLRARLWELGEPVNE